MYREVKRNIIRAIASVLLSSSCATFRSEVAAHPYLMQSREQMYAATQLEGPSIFLENAMDYFELTLPEGATAWWTRTGPNTETALYIFEPAEPESTLVFVHGYLSHSLSAAFLVRHLLNLNIRVVCADLPGHGLSDGEPGDIETFAVYGSFIKDTYDFCQRRWPGPIDFIGHSTGCASMHEFLRQGNSGYNRIIFLSPLVRSWLWEASLTGLSVTEKFSNTFPALRNVVSRDRKYLYKSKLDHLRLRYVSVHWVYALEAWNEELKTDSVPITREILVLQGTADTTIDAPYGKKLYARLFPNLIHTDIPNGIHCLHSDLQPNREIVFREITAYLAD